MVSLILGSHGSLDPFVALRAVLASYFLALATYTYNDITDFDVDRINRSNRPIAAGKSTKNELVIVVSFLYGSALILALSINLNTALVASIFTALGIAYSHPSVNLKDKFPLKTMVTSIGAALSSIIGGIAVSNISIPVIYAALLFFAFFFILGPLGDIADLRGDRAVGRRTFPIVIGIKQTIMLMMSVPIAIAVMTISAHDIIGMHALGAYVTVGVCFGTMALLYYVSKKAEDTARVISIRPKMRFFFVLLQLSLLLGFL
ncbi:MAG: UbiA family prenyltransferase [Nitrososphaerales archaeon]